MVGIARVVNGLGIVVLGLGLATAGCGGGDGTPRAAEAGGGRRGPGGGPGRDAVAVEVQPVRRDAIASLYSTSATLRADKRATVIARTRGVLERLLVEEGDRVRAGQPMAQLEDAEHRIAADRARTTRDTRLREYQRLAQISGQGLVSEDELEQRRREAEDAQHALDLAELTLARTIVRAPFDGVVVTRFLDRGATVADGTGVYEVADLEPLYADVNVPERHVMRLQPGQSVRVSADAAGAATAARIERIAPAVDPETGTVKVTVVVPGGAQLRPGAFVRVDIVTATHEDALVVPRTALVAEGRRWNLYRLTEAGDAVEQVAVDLGFETGEMVEIAGVVEAGRALEPGHLVVTAGAPALSDGAAVNVVADADGPRPTPAVEEGATPAPERPARPRRRG